MIPPMAGTWSILLLYTAEELITQKHSRRPYPVVCLLWAVDAQKIPAPFRHVCSMAFLHGSWKWKDRTRYTFAACLWVCSSIFWCSTILQHHTHVHIYMYDIRRYLTAVLLPTWFSAVNVLRSIWYLVLVCDAVQQHTRYCLAVAVVFVLFNLLFLFFLWLMVGRWSVAGKVVLCFPLLPYREQGG